MLDIKQFKNEIILPALTGMDAYSPAAENLLIGTALVESRLTYIRQLGGGPALGLFQMEPATHDDIWENYLRFRDELADSVRGDSAPYAERLIYDLRYACAMARAHYMRVPKALPDAYNIEGLGAYWKDHYNTNLGKGTVQKFVDAYTEYVED